ncbi:sialoadhesin-like [Centroberyx affinis]|uniref:sialoadhesin-like n=1 Tax=Centroberyx affinis TaxID=166261 RepID=UPI003A5B96C4
MENHHILKIKNLTKSDSAEYILRFLINDWEWQHSGFPGVTLIVTALTVQVTPAVVTEGQRVTLTCSTSCPLTDNTTYIWYQNRRPLTPPESQNKHLVLDPVSSQHAGNYSCAVKTLQHINSPEETLTVTGKSIAIMHAMRLTLVFLSPIALSVFYLWMRKKKTQTSTTEPNDPVQTGQQTDSEYKNMSALAMNPVSAAQREAAEQQEDSV